MKNTKIFIASALVIAMAFFGCSKDEETTPTGSGSGDGFPSDFMASKDTTTFRAALLEDFTGVRCGFCPDGHDKAKAAKLALGAEKFIILAVHGGSYATPAPGWQDFTTPFAQALISQAKVSGYPAGSISRIKAADLGANPQISGGLAMSRSAWASAGTTVNSMKAPVNIGAKATLSGRELTVVVDVYYTEDVATSNINVALVQDGISSKQSGGSNPYIQNNMLRDLITGQWGDPVTEAKKKGDFVRRTYTYTIPTEYNGSGADGGGPVVLADMRVTTFVTKGQANVLNVIETKIK